jgi:diguanylate cyclase (GGDEF)-like protein
MNIGLNADLPKGRARALSLAKLLQRCEDVKVLVVESARELLALNAAVKQDLKSRDSLPASESALRTSEAIQGNMQAASEKLSVVVSALESEVRERNMLDHQFAAAVEQEEGARHASLHDALTGLPNRALFNDRLERGFALAKRHGWTLALMFVDLDDFKEINDRYGHDIGDSVLQTIARRLQDNTRGEDTVSRHGGDEFLYLAMDIQKEANISLIAEKIMEEIQAPLNVNVRDLNTSLSITASIGISIFPKHGTDADMLVKSADKAMYRAKQNKSGYSFAE